jgi:hypothetical protein
MSRVSQLALISAGVLSLGLSPILIGSQVGATAVLEQRVEQKFVVDSDVTVSIENKDGSIRIQAADILEVQIQATKKAYGQDRLKSISVQVQATPKNVSIETVLTLKNGLFDLGDKSGAVDYVVTVPKAARITQVHSKSGIVLLDGLVGGNAVVHVENGWLVAHNCFLNLDLNLANGRLEMSYDRWDATRFHAKLTSPEGDIRVNFPHDASLSIQAQTVKGRIVNGLAAKSESDGHVLRRLEFEVGEKVDAGFELTTGSGDIRINWPN